MLSAWWLLLIIPAATFLGYLTCATMAAGALADMRDYVAMKLKEMEADEPGAKKGQDHEG